MMEAPQYSNNPGYLPNGSFYNSGVASTFGAFNQMFNPSFGGYGMMGGYGSNFGAYNPMFQPMGAFNGNFNGAAPGYPPAPLSAGARQLGDRIGDRAAGFEAQPMRMNGSSANKRARRESGLPPPPKGAKIDPRAGKLHAYTDLDGPPASGGGEDMVLDY